MAAVAAVAAVAAEVAGVAAEEGQEVVAAAADTKALLTSCTTCDKPWPRRLQLSTITRHFDVVFLQKPKPEWELNGDGGSRAVAGPAAELACRAAAAGAPGGGGGGGGQRGGGREGGGGAAAAATAAATTGVAEAVGAVVGRGQKVATAAADTKALLASRTARDELWPRRLRLSTAARRFDIVFLWRPEPA